MHQCLALIKQRNPKIFASISQKITLHDNFFSIDYDNGVEGMLPIEMQSLLKKNSSLLLQLTPIIMEIKKAFENHPKITRRELLDGQVCNYDIWKSFGSEIPLYELNWYLDKYYVLLTMIASFQLRESKRACATFKAFQELLVSWYLLQKRNAFKVSGKYHFLDKLILRFIKNKCLKIAKNASELLPSDISRFFLDNLGLEITLDLDMKAFIKYHFQLISKILNARIRHANQLDKDDIVVTIECFEDILQLVEALIYLFNEMKENEIRRGPLATNSKSKFAYKEIYDNRKPKIVYSHFARQAGNLINDEKILGTQAKKSLLKMIIRELFRLVSNLHWKELPLTDDTIAIISSFPDRVTKRRLYIQAGLLMGNDLELIASFRLTKWPHYKN